MSESREARCLRVQAQQTQPQCSSSFMERVNKVTTRQLFQATKGAGKENAGLKERLRTISPFLQKKLDTLKSARTTRVRLCDRLKGTDTSPFTTTRRQENRHQRQLACFRFSTVLISSLRVAFADIRRVRRPAPKLDLSQMVAFTQCRHCCAVSLTLLTTSTQNKFSPRFLDKVKCLLPAESLPTRQTSPEPREMCALESELSMVLYAEKEPMEEKKLSLPDLSFIAMEGSLSSLSSQEAAPVPLKKQESVVSRDYWDRSTDCKTPCDTSSQSYRRPSPVPRLNISELLPAKHRAKVPVASVEVLQGSPLLRKDTAAARLDRLVEVFQTRIHKAFDMVFLSRANKKLADQSLTFDFSREEESSQASGVLTGTFRQQEKLCNISAIQPVKFTEDSFVFECESRPEVSSTAKTAFRILFSRLEKAVARRKLRGFYCIAGA